MRKPVAIFGAGPSGLFAAQAVELAGCEPIIMSMKVKSLIYGAQYLHRPIPGLADKAPAGRIKTFRLGTPERYAERVYGDETRLTSWHKVSDEPVPAWDLRITYDRAWEKFSDRIIDTRVSVEDVEQFTSQFDVVISTIPLWSICTQPNICNFKSVPILVKKKMEYTGLPDYFHDGNGGVVYNGTEVGYWYRTSYIFGHESTEAVANLENEELLRTNDEWATGYKIAGTDCECHPNLVKAGRLGRWQPGILTHNAFEQAIEALSDKSMV